MFKLDDVGICASGGSACSTGSANPSHVLMAIGANSERAKSALRVTFGIENDKEDVDFLVEQLIKIISNLKNE